MVVYTPQYIETKFREIASLRISKKRRNDEQYKGDAGYWDGGRCDYGMAHNLQEDCRTLAKFFGDITELKDARRRLTTFNNQEEFDKTKQNLLAKANQAVNGLQMKTGASTSVGGICIIWADFSNYLNQIIDDFRREVESLRNDIERVPYNEAKELQKLNREETRLKKEIEENERNARNETDPEKKKKFLFLVEEAKTKWKKVIERKKQLKSSNLGDNLDPDKHISDFFNELEGKLSGKNRPPKGSRTPNSDPKSSGSSLGGGGKTDPQDPFKTNPNQNPKDWFQENKSLIILSSISLLVILYLINQNKKEQNYYDF